MRLPAKHIADCVKIYDVTTNIGNLWVLARPEPYPDWRLRWKLAFDVFIGKADALYWNGQ